MPVLLFVCDFRVGTPKQATYINPSSISCTSPQFSTGFSVGWTFLSPWTLLENWNHHFFVQQSFSMSVTWDMQYFCSAKTFITYDDPAIFLVDPQVYYHPVCLFVEHNQSTHNRPASILAEATLLLRLPVHPLASTRPRHASSLQPTSLIVSVWLLNSSRCRFLPTCLAFLPPHIFLRTSLPLQNSFENYTDNPASDWSICLAGAGKGRRQRDFLPSAINSIP